MTGEAWDTSTLEQHLTQAGSKLSDDLHDRIIVQGKVIVPALLDVLNNEPLQMEDAPGEGWAPIHAVGLLAELRAEEAIPSMLDWLLKLDWNTILHSKLIFGLKALGQAVFEPVMEAYRNNEDPDIDGSLLDVLSELGHKDEELFQILIDKLETDTVMGAANLASYGDSRALEVLHKAFDEYQFIDDEDSLFIDQPIIELKGAIEALGGQLSSDQERKYEQVIVRREFFMRRIQAFASSSRSERGIPVNKKKKPGRNDPCWCGSGKKYKKCHLDADRAASN